MEIVPLFLFPFTFILSAAALAADISIVTSLDKQQIAMNEQAVLSVTVSGNVSNLPEPQLPDLSAFQMYNAGTSQSYSWVNGEASASVRHSYVLTPKQEGHFVIAPVRVPVEGKVLESSPLTLDVVKGTPAALPPETAMATASVPQNAGQGAPAVFISATVDKPTAYVGEPITLSFRLFNRAAFLRQPQYQPPDTSGFWAEDLPPQRNYSANVKGVPYQVTEVRTALFPIHPGKATIGTANLTVQIQNFSSDPLEGDFFGQFFGGGQQKTLQTNPITVQVKSLPSPEPPGFRGAVGQYTMKASLDKTSTTVGQPLTLTVTIEGQGNIKSLPELAMPTLANFRTFDANAATNIEKKDYHVQGSKVFKTVLIPTTSGKLTIPPVPFVYFDPGARAYKTLRSQPLEVQVQPGAAGSTPAFPVNTPGAPAPEGIRVLNEDIRYIKTPATLFSQTAPLYRSKGFIGFNLLAFLGMVLSGLIPLYRRLFLSDPQWIRFRNARNRAQVHIKEAETAADRSDRKQAAGALARALQGYVSDKLNLDETGLSLRSALTELGSRQVKAPTIEQLRDVWESLDLFQFAPSQTTPEDLRKTSTDLKELIIQLEKEIEWKN